MELLGDMGHMEFQMELLGDMGHMESCFDPFAR